MLFYLSSLSPITDRRSPVGATGGWVSSDTHPLVPRLLFPHPLSPANICDNISLGNVRLNPCCFSFIFDLLLNMLGWYVHGSMLYWSCGLHLVFVKSSCWQYHAATGVVFVPIIFQKRIVREPRLFAGWFQRQWFEPCWSVRLLAVQCCCWSGIHTNHLSKKDCPRTQIVCSISGNVGSTT